MDSGTSGITCSSALLAAALMSLAYLHRLIPAYKAEVCGVRERDSFLALIAQELYESLCDDTSEEATMYGATPMSTRRTIVEAASLV